MIKIAEEALKDDMVFNIQVGSPLHTDRNIISFMHKDKYYSFYVYGLERLQNTDEGLKELIKDRAMEAING